MFLRKWPVSRSLTKVLIGRLYVCIDPQLYRKGVCSRPDNVYQFIERVALSDRPSPAPMSYGLDATVKRLHKELSVYSNEVEELSSRAKKQEEELTKMKRDVERARVEVNDAKCALNDVMRQFHIAEKQRDSSGVPGGVLRVLEHPHQPDSLTNVFFQLECL